MTVHMLPDRELPNQEAVDLIVALQRCLTNFHGRRDEMAILPSAGDGWAAWLRHYRGARQLRHMIIGDGLFADPAWDILLLLYQAELEERVVPVDEAAKEVGVPRVAALSHILRLERRGLLVLMEVPPGGTNPPIRLTPLAIDAMTSWLRLTFGEGDAAGAGQG